MNAVEEARGLFFEARDLIQARQFEAAEAKLRRALALVPGRVSVLTKLGGVLVSLNRHEEAATVAEQAAAIDPQHAEAWLVLGQARQVQQRTDDALRAFDRLVALLPNDAEAWGNRGRLHAAAFRFGEAAADYQRAAELRSGSGAAPMPGLEGELLHARMRVADWRTLPEERAAIVAAIGAGRLESPPLALLAITDDLAIQFAAGRMTAEHHRPMLDLRVPEGGYRHDRIRVAYLSPDFWEHPVSYLMAGVFEHHDRQRVETLGISIGRDDGSAMRRRVVASFDTFVDAAAWTDAALATWVREHEIDVLVDLAGHTSGGRLGVLAERPAPVQVNYLGFPGTMGASYVNYIVADAFVVPPDAEPFYSEKIVRLPECFQANDDRRPSPGTRPSRSSVGLPETGFVFCSFNNTYKIHPEFFDVWMRLLSGIPGSVLWMLGEDAAARSNLVQAAVQCGVQPGRLVFAERVPYAAHLARFGLADLFLDTLPFNAGTTASDALWASVPVVTCAGRSFAARMAGSLLRTVGLPDLVTSTLADYEALALRLASDPAALAEVKARLAQNRRTAPLFDTALFTRSLEAAYATMVETAARGLPPATFTSTAG